MNKRIWTNRLRYILVSGLIALVGLGIGISCSKDAGISSISPTEDSVSSRRLVGTKPAVGGSNYADFHPQTNVNYDPFKGMTWDDRKAALGGIEGAVKHLRVVAARVAQAMQDKSVRKLLHSMVPKEREGEVHLFQIMMDNPKFFGLASEGFKGAISDKGIGANLSAIIQDTPSDGEAILKASKALLDVVMVVVTPPGKEWDGEAAIPVFSAPADDAPGNVMEGVDTQLKPISLTLQKGNAPYTFLFLNFDEDSPMIREGRSNVSISFEEEPTPIENLWASIRNTFRYAGLTTPANAHVQGSGVVHYCHSWLVAPVHAIMIHDDSEGWGGWPPEVYVDIKIRLIPVGSFYHEDKYYLPEVNDTDEWYHYPDLYSTHGIKQEWNFAEIKQIRIMEEDPGLDDYMGKWNDITLPQKKVKTLGRISSSNGEDATIKVVWHAHD